MKIEKILLTICLLSYWTFASAQDVFWKPFKNDCEKLGVDSSTQKLVQFHYRCSKEGDSIKIYNRTEMRTYNFIKVFNDHGNITSEILFNSDSTIYRWTDYQYNDSLLKKKVSTYDSIKFHTTVYSYDDNQNQIKEVEIFYTGDTSKVVTKNYDDQGRLIELNSEDFNGDNLKFRKVYKYFTSENRIQEKIYSNSTEVNETRDYIYNDSLDLIELQIKSKGFFRKSKYEYNEYGDLVKMINYPLNGSDGLKRIYKYSYNYGIDGSWVQKTEYSNLSQRCQTYIRVIQ